MGIVATKLYRNGKKSECKLYSLKFKFMFIPNEQTRGNGDKKNSLRWHEELKKGTEEPDSKENPCPFKKSSSLLSAINTLSKKL